ncbi:MAG: hypothetical protein J7L63_01435 [Thermoplasmata archaeon]|nr:hypothetical protein [Thermoplasmata archaeon]
MKLYTLVDVLLFILVFVDLVLYYPEFLKGRVPSEFIIILVLITIGYFMALNALNQRTKKIFERVSSRLGCKFTDLGFLTLKYRITCDDMEIDGTLRSTYLPESLHIKFNGKFKDAIFRGKDRVSKEFTDKLAKLGIKYGVRINDAYLSSTIGEILLTKIPGKEDNLVNLLNELRECFTEFKE